MDLSIVSLIFRLSKLHLNVTMRERGFNEVTIGADNDDVERLTSMYNCWGFSELIKYQYTDYHYIGKDGKPVTYEITFGLYLNRLGKGEE